MIKRIREQAGNWVSDLDTITKLFAFFTGSLWLISFLGDRFASSAPIFAWMRDSFVWIWLSALTIFVFVVYQSVAGLRKKFVDGYSVNLYGDPSHIWESRDGTVFRTTNEHSLIVTNSSEGCITRVGRFWENYDFTFQAMLKNHCIGVIFRAESINNYYMFQINRDGVVFHRKALLPVGEVKFELQPDESISVKMPEYGIIWQTSEKKPLNISLNEWFDVRINVKGDTASLYINDNLVCQEGLLQISAGKIGFRNHGDERALVKNIRIKLQPYS